jgi:hypothetical protein
MTDEQDSIFSRGEELYGNATLGFDRDKWHLYAYGFRRAAEILLQHVETQHTSLDVIVYPTLFLYRHHLELAIKLLARDARILLSEPPPQKPHHRLLDLWADTKALVTRVYSVEQAGLEQIDAVVSQMDEIDPTSTAFRYPEARGGSSHLSGITTINFFTLRDSLEPAFDMLDAAHDALSAELEGLCA